MSPEHGDTGGCAAAVAQRPRTDDGADACAAGAPAEAARLVSSKDFKRGALTSAHVKDASLSTADLAPGVLGTPLPGPAGARGPAGPGRRERADRLRRPSGHPR